MNEELNLKAVRVHRTLEGTLFEVAAAGVLIGAWLVAYRTHLFAGERAENMWVVMPILTLSTIALLAGAYHPRWLNLSTKLRNLRQVAIACRLTRILALELSLFAMAHATISESLYGNKILSYLPMAVILLTVTIANAMLRKAA